MDGVNPSVVVGHPLPPVYKPVLMAYEEFRKPINIMPPRPIAVDGRMVLYKNNLYINDPDVGSHVCDDSDPSKPIDVGFLPIVGSQEFSIINDRLYIKLR